MNNLIKKGIDLNKIELSFDETYHIYKGKPLYSARFEKVMSFHFPGIAAVKDESGAYHIDLEGKPIYKNRYIQTFGYYENLAAVSDKSGWYHINLKGEPIYNERYAWVGNFQEGMCPVRFKDGFYSHIKIDGSLAYNKKYKYAGDFKYGVAVVYLQDGFARHINKEGKFIHKGIFEELGVFHKGFATAKDNFGMFHINKEGKSLYNDRYLWIEPFYNGQSLVRNNNGELIIIDEEGKIIHHIFDQNSQLVKNNLKHKLMDMVIGFWKTQIIYSISKLKILDFIKNGVDTFDILLKATKLPKPSLKLIIDFLKVYNFIKIEEGKYSLNYLGELLTEKHVESFKSAALMWGSEHYQVMGELFNALKEYKAQFEKIYGAPIFIYFNENPNRGKIFNRAMESYSFDYEELIENYDFSGSKIIMDVGGGTGKLLFDILSKNPNIHKGIIFELPSVIKHLKKHIDNKLKEKIELISGNFFEKIPKKADTIILSRVLHDWDNDNAIKILKNINSVLNSEGTLLILEMIIPNQPEYDFGISLNFNLLVMTGGKERSLEEFKQLLKKSGFKITNIIQKNSIISMIIAKKIKKNN